MIGSSVIRAGGAVTKVYKVYFSESGLHGFVGTCGTDSVGLQDGEVFTLGFFYAHRNGAPMSLFHMRTNLALATDGPGVITMPYD